MTVSTTIIKNFHNGNGSATNFAYQFRILQDTDLLVIIRTNSTGAETTKTLSTHYTVAGAGDASGGSITFTAGNIPASGETVVIRRNVPQTQAIDYIANDPFPAETHEEGLDRGTMVAQQVAEESDRSIKLSRTNTMNSTEFTVGATDRANKILAFDSSGEISVTQELGTYQGTDATTTTAAYVVRDIIKSTTAGQLNNVYICIADSVIGDLLTDTDHFELLVDAVSAATSANNAAISAAAAAADLLLTNADVVLTNADVVSTNADVVLTNADVVSTNADAAATAADLVATNQDTIDTAADLVATNADAAATAADLVATNQDTLDTAADLALTNADVVLTHADVVLTHADVVLTAADAAATALDKIATNADVVLTAADVVSSAASAAAAAASADAFDDVYLGSKSSDPTTDNDGDALAAGMLYYNTVSNLMRIYSGSAWENVAVSTAGFATLTGVETLTNKTLTSPKINEDVAVTSTATELNLLDGVSGLVQADFTKLAAIDATAAEIDTLDGLSRGSIIYGNASAATAILTKGTVGQVLTSDGTDIAWGDAASGLEWQSSIVTASTLTAEAGKGYWIDTTSNTCTITLPSSASVGDQLIFVDYARNWGTNEIIIDSNGLNYQGNDDTYTVEYNTSGETINIVYSGATNGWIPLDDGEVEKAPVAPPTQKGIFAYGIIAGPGRQSIKNLVSSSGVIASDTSSTGTARAYAAAATYGFDKGIIGFGNLGSNSNLTNLVSNTGVMSADVTGVGTARSEVSATGFGLSGEAIFLQGNGGLSSTNKVSSSGVVATDVTQSNGGRANGAAVTFGLSGQAIKGFGGGPTTAITNLISNTGVIASDTAAVGTARFALAATKYGTGLALFGFGDDGPNSVSITNKVSITGVVASDTTGVGTGRQYIAASSYGGDKGIFGFGTGVSGESGVTNLVSNTGVVASDTAAVGTARNAIVACGYSSSA